MSQPASASRTVTSVASVDLSPQQVLFADLVAGGETYSNAAEIAGFARDSGRNLARIPAIRNRIEAQVVDPQRARVIADYTLAVIRTRDAVCDGKIGDSEWRANMALHLQALDRLAKICGWIIDRKQVDKRSVSTNLRVTREELEAKLQADLERLAPGAITALESLGAPASDTDLKAIASGQVTVTSHSASLKSK